MRSMSKLALLVAAGAPLMLLPGSALADGQSTAPAPAAATAPAPQPAAPASATPTPPVTPTPSASPTTPPAAAAPVTVDLFPAKQPYEVGNEPEPPAPKPADGLVKVHIQTKELVTIEHRRGPEAAWEHGCETPCDARLPANDEYRIVGNGVVDSPTFLLTSPKGDMVKVHVAPGIKSKAKVGEILTFTGAVLVVGALVVGIGSADPGSVFSSNGGNNTDNYNWDVLAVGTGVAVAGIVTGVLGGAWWYDNSHTRIAGDVQEEGTQPASRGGMEPRYQTGMRFAAPGLQTYSAPIFSTSF